MNERTGKVYLVGAGPGDPALITLRGAECLRRADVVLFDYLVSPELLALANPEAERICLGRHGQGRLWSQADVNDALVEHARLGRDVVRLKGGDPLIFARAAEELAALVSAGISYEIVPGVTASQVASSHAGIPLTNRDDASCVALVTGHESCGKEPDGELDYGSLATFPGTLVFYMGITTAAKWSGALMAGGKPAATPVAIVRRASLPDQQIVRTTLDKLAEVVAARHLRPPAIVIVGEVARETAAANWFTTRALFGTTVLVTRPVHQADELAEKLRELGARVMYQPAIEICAPDNWEPVDATIRRIEEFDWLVFSSANGVNYFVRRMMATGLDARHLGRCKLAAIGPATSQALAEYHLRADIQPDEYRAEALAEVLGPHVGGRRVLLVRASRGREVLAAALASAGAIVDQIVAYESRDVATPDEQVQQTLAAGHMDWVTVTSSAIARSLVAMFGEALRKTQLVAISPLTAEVLCELGYPPAIVAETSTCDGIVAAILAARRRKV